MRKKVDKKLQYSLGSKLYSKAGWHTQEDSRSSYRTVNLKNAALSATALKAVLAFMYTERLDVTIEDVDAVLRVAKKCKMHAVCYSIIKQSAKHSQWIHVQLTSKFCQKHPTTSFLTIKVSSLSCLRPCRW